MSSHNHRVHVAEAYRFLRINEDTKSAFHHYFDQGMTPSAARTFHDIESIASYHCEDDEIKLLADASMNPTEKQIAYLYDVWRKYHFGGRDSKSIIEVLKIKQDLFTEKQIQVLVKQDPLTIVIITPIMRRALESKFAGEIVFVDSSGSCDQGGSNVTFLFGATKAGGIPLACILHQTQSEDGYRNAFLLAREAIGSQGFGGKGAPDVFMTDISAAERNSLKTVFPSSKLLLCIFHVCQALWRRPGSPNMASSSYIDKP